MKPGNRKAIFILSMGITIVSLFAFAGKHHFNHRNWQQACGHHTSCSSTSHTGSPDTWDGSRTETEKSVNNH